ncbi:hypothetical protein BGW36DRAFT_396433 [Talaromyces proteolyticus]|uniref:NmrA-like domain-containing protein n=1 Tax=Talaromyces proteolyticus TaxID=1131652 RepID=A0AAD4KTX9_9EURO|nr:uncharacterized protein BGW36DRAFT_396433 [Talaromyces proteolyticus]KAH8698725.1 hypothetical protein BGW36DRAFT_396433 [Talaromyces proteolyticus]
MSLKGTSRNIIVAGGSGRLGSYIVSGLLAKGIHNISAISRVGSTAQFPSGVTIHRGLYTDETFLNTVLQKQDVLIVCLAKATLDFQLLLIRAAAKAGVPYVLPSEYGVDSSSKEVIKHLPVIKRKVEARELIEELGVSSWIAVASNPLISFHVRNLRLGIDVKNRTATIWDNGTRKRPLTTLEMLGKSVAGLLSLPEEELATNKNQHVYISSFYVSQRDILASVIRATGTKEKDWTIENVKLDDFLAEKRAEFDRGNLPIIEKMILLVAFKDGLNDFQSVVNYKRLGVDPESLDDFIKQEVRDYHL